MRFVIAVFGWGWGGERGSRPRPGVVTVHTNPRGSCSSEGGEVLAQNTVAGDRERPSSAETSPTLVCHGL